MDRAGAAPREQERARVRVKAAEQPLVRERQHLSILSLMGFAAVAALAVLVLMSYIQLTALSNDTVALKKELAELKTAQVTLTAQHERVFDIGTVKETARAAGMAKPGSSQICYLDLAGADSAVVYATEESSLLSRLLHTLHHGAYTVVEYFK